MALGRRNCTWPPVVARLTARAALETSFRSARRQAASPPWTSASAIHELYWQDYDPGERKPDETWPQYADRSWKELLFLVGTLPSDDAIMDGARRLWPWLKMSNAEAAEVMWFVVYLVGET